jgi:hypothetical protein
VGCLLSGRSGRVRSYLASGEQDSANEFVNSESGIQVAGKKTGQQDVSFRGFQVFRNRVEMIIHLNIKNC